ncbi:MAG: Lipopolysaccharide kinase (Kdo/WaaP) family [Rariglobus sp.]|jgi:serine/threonine protein kinase|nr:Lipopolysaccharide kinase (Kdo/WaaP) family [Rariglobus sp.]
MLKIHQHRPLSKEAIDQVFRYRAWPPFKRVLWANPFKHRYVFPLEADGQNLIVKVYHHGSLHYRLAALLGWSHADRYYRHATRLAAANVAVPGPIMLMKWGPRNLPHQTLFVMEYVDGREMTELLAEIEQSDERIKKVASQVAGLIDGLSRARVSHRDLNVKNFLVSPDDTVTLIDLDSASYHRSGGRTFARKHRRDIQSFLTASRGAPKFSAAVASKLKDR